MPFLVFLLVLVYDLLRNVWFCACVGISFIERGMCSFALVLVYGL